MNACAPESWFHECAVSGLTLDLEYNFHTEFTHMPFSESRAGLNVEISNRSECVWGTRNELGQVYAATMPPNMRPLEVFNQTENKNLILWSRAIIRLILELFKQVYSVIVRSQLDSTHCLQAWLLSPPKGRLEAWETTYEEADLMNLFVVDQTQTSLFNQSIIELRHRFSDESATHI